MRIRDILGAHRKQLKRRKTHMTEVSGKKIIILYILLILRNYTDKDHTMTQ